MWVSIVQVNISPIKMYVVKFNVEKFDGKKINFGGWKVQVKDILIHHRFYKALKGRTIVVASGSFGEKNLVKISLRKSKKSLTSDDEWEELVKRAASLIQLCLAKNFLTNI